MPEPDEQEERGHAFERLLGFIGQRFVRLRPAGSDAGIASVGGFALRDNGVAERESPVPIEFRRTRMLEFRGRVHEQGSAARLAMQPAFGMAPAAAVPAPANNWIPIGPSVLRKGQAANRPAVSGRVPGIAVAPGGMRVYVASANGGVWRSDDGGLNWFSTMEAFNLQPTAFCSDSLACGAIAIDPNNPDRVYVGTGEGDNVFISGTTVAGTGAYFGVGPIRSDDGGLSWHTEPTAPNSPALTGASFYKLAIDPANRDHVIAATILGLYRREPDGAGSFHWRQVQTGIFSSVVAAKGPNGVVFYGGAYGGTVFTSTDGVAWSSLPAGFPTANVGRIGLGIQPDNPAIVYALICRANNFHVLGVWRFDGSASAWQAVKGAPSDLFGPAGGGGQGTYDLAIAIDPRNANRIYLGGSTRLATGQWAASLFRADVTADAGAPGFTMAATPIGANVHADVHTLEFTPGSPDDLWVGCDGGVFKTGTASTRADFESRNIGLMTLTMNRLGIHPDQDAVLFCGTQDNGTVRYTGDEAWLHAAPGDGGYVAVNCANPYKVLRTYVQNILAQATDGGQTYGSWKGITVPLNPRTEEVEFYAPLASAPPSGNPADADVAAFGSVRPWVSTDFGLTWRSIPNNNPFTDRLDSAILSLSFASAAKFYAGTREGGVYRCQQSDGAWTVAPIHADPLLAGPVTAIAIDHADASGDSVYICFGGIGDPRRVWHFDSASGTWEARSGPAGNPSRGLMDVQHNAIVADPKNIGTLYTGADIGVWRSTDGGANWEPFAEGLPEAAVLDLKLHPSRRLLWAATYGRGVYERAVDEDSALPVELYLRHTQLDRGRYPTVDAQPDPTQPGKTVSFRRAPGVKVDAPDASGAYQTATNQVDFFQFVDTLQDAGIRIAAGPGGAINRVYVQVHSRGVMPASKVQVMLLIAPTTNGAAPDLPAGYDGHVRTATPIAAGPWQTAGITHVSDIRAGLPRIAAFDLPSNLVLPLVAGASNTNCLLALLHSADDPYTNTATQVDTLCVSERKAAQHCV